MRKIFKKFFIDYGKRKSTKVQLFPIWNTSNNCQKSILIGFGFLFFEVGLIRRNWVYDNKLFELMPFRHISAINRLYQLIF